MNSTNRGIGLPLLGNVTTSDPVASGLAGSDYRMIARPDAAETYLRNPFRAPAAPDPDPEVTAAMASGDDMLSPTAFGEAIERAIDPSGLVDQFLEGRITPEMLKGDRGKYLMMQIQMRMDMKNQIFQLYSNIMKSYSDAHQKLIDNLR